MRKTEDVRCPGTGINDYSELVYCEYWELNSGPLQYHYVVLTTEPKKNLLMNIVSCINQNEHIHLAYNSLFLFGKNDFIFCHMLM